MKKCLALLLALMLLVCASCALAEAAPVLDAENSVCPLNMPPVPEEIYAQWQLFATDAPLELEMSALVDPETNQFVVILNNLLPGSTQDAVLAEIAAAFGQVCPEGLHFAVFP